MQLSSRGVFGSCVALVGAVENQHLGTQHFHGLVFLANVNEYHEGLGLPRQ